MAATAKMPKPKLLDNALYLGDNGRCFCGAHAGTTAKYTGRDLSGQRVMKLTAADAAYSASKGWPAAKCETPGCAVVVL